MKRRVIQMFSKPSAAEIVENNLEEYQRQLVDHQAATSYHKKMAEYYAEGLERLQRFKPLPSQFTPGT